jgi:signal peptidase I
MARQREKSESSDKKEKSGFRQYADSFLVALAIALLIRAVVIYPFRIPTGSMEDTLLVGDFLLANKFVYGVRSPDWIGIPYTKIGFKIPFFRTPGFRKPLKGDVVIFKYPRDITLNYIKRCVATSGDTVLVRNKQLFVNGRVFPNAPKSKFIHNMVYPADFEEYGVYPPGAGNRDNYGPVRVPVPGDTFRFTESNRSSWSERLQIMLYEDADIQVRVGGERIRLTVDNQNQWPSAIQKLAPGDFWINGKPLGGAVYTVKNRHFFMMGDNRDNSLDSRYWGFLPERLVVGEALVIYWSWDSDVPLYRLFKKIRWNRLLNLIR